MESFSDSNVRKHICNLPEGFLHGSYEYLWLFAGHRTQLCQCCGQEGGEEEGGAQEVQDLQREVLTQHMLQEPYGDLQQSGGEVHTHLHHILGARCSRPTVHTLHNGELFSKS